MEKKIKREKKKIRNILEEKSVDDAVISILDPIIEHTVLMRIKLDEAKNCIKEENVAIPYDNGGGQAGIRENPFFKGYESLFRTYMSGVNKILDAIPKNDDATQQKDDGQKNVLQLVRSKHGA